LPHIHVNRILSGQCAIEGWILSPGGLDVPEIALRRSLAGNASATRQSFNCYFVETLALLSRPTA